MQSARCGSGNSPLSKADASTSSITGSSATITVSAAAATHFAVSAPGTATAGVGFGLTVTALDPFNNKASGYGGTVGFSSSDHGAATFLPGSSTLAAGVDRNSVASGKSVG